jgi:hypothetical protein
MVIQVLSIISHYSWQKLGEYDYLYVLDWQYYLDHVYSFEYPIVHLV